MKKVIPMHTCKHCKKKKEHTKENFYAQNNGSLRNICIQCIDKYWKNYRVFGKDKTQTHKSVRNEVEFFLKADNSKRIGMGLA